MCNHFILITRTVLGICCLFVMGLPKFWGSGKRVSADGTKWDLYEQNLLSEYHIRYGGYGGIGYYHVSDTYIALFSHFIPCGVWEAVYIHPHLAYESKTMYFAIDFLAKTLAEGGDTERLKPLYILFSEFWHEKAGLIAKDPACLADADALADEISKRG